MIKLNLGCGAYLLDGYRNIDRLNANGEIKGVQYGDITKLDCCESNSIGEIYSAHVLQCFHDRELVPVALKEWHRILKPGGTLIVEVPYILPLIKDYLSGKLPHDLFIQGMYGALGEHNLQTTCFDRPYLSDLLTEAGFTGIKQILQPKHSVHNAQTNLTMTATKP